MDKVLKYLRRYRWILCGVFALVVVASWGSWVSRRLSQDLKAFTFQSYISQDYMPSQRKRTGKWPGTLSDFLKHMEESDFVAKDVVVEYYQKGFIKMEPIQMCPDSYVYRIFTANGSRSCKVTINPDSGRCWSDST